MVQVGVRGAGALPLTPTASSDRMALPARSDAGTLLRLPRIGAGGDAGALFAEVLGLGQVGVATTSSRLGGRQHHVDPAGERARQAGLVIHPRAVFQQQTVAALAARRQPQGGGRRRAAK